MHEVSSGSPEEKRGARDLQGRVGGRTAALHRFAVLWNVGRVFLMFDFIPWGLVLVLR